MKFKTHVAIGVGVFVAFVVAGLVIMPMIEETITCELPPITSNAPRDLISRTTETSALEHAYRRAGVEDACRAMEGVTIALEWTEADGFEGCDSFKDQNLRGCARKVAPDSYEIEIDLGRALRAGRELYILEHEYTHVLLWRLGVPTEMHHQFTDDTGPMRWRDAMLEDGEVSP